MSGLLTVWLSGFVFLLCCGMTNSPKNISSCPLAKSGNHCGKTNLKSGSPTFSNESEDQNFDCCAFLPALFEKTRKLEKNQQTSQVPGQLKIDLPHTKFAVSSLQIVTTYTLPDFEREKIFIKNCVFRI